jgi:hypothetical protein
MSPRKNSKAQNRRRGLRPLQIDPEPAISFEALAKELVRRGLASKTILDRPDTPNTLHDPHEMEK